MKIQPIPSLILTHLWFMLQKGTVANSARFHIFENIVISA